LAAEGPSQAWTWSRLTEEQQTHIESIHAHGQALAAQAQGLTNVEGAQKRLSAATEEGTEVQQKAGRTASEQVGFLGSLTRQFEVHLRWMLRYIILWKGMQLVTSIVRNWFQANVTLNRSLTLLEASIGGNVVQLRQYRDALYDAAAAAAAMPTGMAPAAQMMGRIYGPQQAEAMMTRAGELAMLSGAQVVDVASTLIVVQRQLGLSSERMTQVMDAMAGSLRNTHLTYADMVPMLLGLTVWKTPLVLFNSGSTPLILYNNVSGGQAFFRDLSKSIS